MVSETRTGPGSQSYSTSSPSKAPSNDCEPGPVRVSLTVRTGRVQSLRTYVGGRWVTPPRDAAVTDLGTVSSRDATDLLLGLATREDTRGGEEAILPLTMADSVTVWPMLLKLARDDRAPRRTRRQAVFC